MKKFNLKLFLIILTILNINTKFQKNFYKTREITKNDFSRDFAIYFSYLASYGYCTVDNMVNGKCCSEWINKENWELVEAMAFPIDDYNMAILKNDEQKKIVLTFPGTRGIYQFLKEAYNSFGVGLEDDPTEKIMLYFNNVYFSSQMKIQEMIGRVMENYPDYQYIFTGHSLGGAIASITALDSAKYGKIKLTENSPVLITYGQPRTGNSIFANELMKHIPIVFRIVRNGDLIVLALICSSNFISSECLSSLPSSKFDKNLILTEAQIQYEIKYYCPWHIGGLKIFNNEMTQFFDCGDEYGENHPDKKCLNSVSLNIINHLSYFGKRIASYCKTIE